MNPMQLGRILLGLGGLGKVAKILQMQEASVVTCRGDAGGERGDQAEVLGEA